MKKRPPMAYVIWGLVALLLVLHQDNWFWDDDRLLLGFLPIGLAYHAGISLAAGITWFLATRFAWPADPEKSVAADASEGGQG